MDVPLPPPAPALPLPPAPTAEEAAVRLQRWYRGQGRRRRFMVIVNRARRRRKYLEDRRRVAQRVYATEAGKTREEAARDHVLGRGRVTFGWAYDLQVGLQKYSVDYG